jgi:hypothetical protein
MYTKIIVEEIFGEDKDQLVWAAINSCVRELFEEYKKIYAPTEVTTEVTDPSEAKGGRGGKLREVIAKRMKMNNYSSSTMKSELENYLTKETKDTDTKIDILFWWK